MQFLEKYYIHFANTFKLGLIEKLIITYHFLSAFNCVLKNDNNEIFLMHWISYLELKKLCHFSKYVLLAEKKLRKLGSCIVRMPKLFTSYSRRGMKYRLCSQDKQEEGVSIY